MMLYFKVYFFKDFIFIIKERRREGEREGEKHQCVVASHTPSVGAHNPGMCPTWESNQQLFDSQAHAQSIELHQLGYFKVYFILT